MGYTVDLENDRLCCKSKADAEAAEAIIHSDPRMHPCHMGVSARASSWPPTDDSWELSVEVFDGCSWSEEDAHRLWLAIAPHLSDGAFMVFRSEDSERWRIRWEDGHVYEESVQDIVWKVNREILPPQKERAS